MTQATAVHLVQRKRKLLTLFSILIILNSFPVPECREDPDCQIIKYCEATNQTCSDPCIRDPCGPNAFGTPGIPINHVCNCQCVSGFTGNPKTGCGQFILLTAKWIRIDEVAFSF